MKKDIADIAYSVSLSLVFSALLCLADLGIADLHQTAVALYGRTMAMGFLGMVLSGLSVRAYMMEKRDRIFVLGLLVPAVLYALIDYNLDISTSWHVGIMISGAIVFIYQAVFGPFRRRLGKS